MYWEFKKKIYDLDKMSVESFKQLTGLTAKDFSDLTGIVKPVKVERTVEVGMPDITPDAVIQDDLSPKAVVKPKKK
jgi:hypothetical protein